ncbi:MAG: hypothetical protein IKQ67_00555 [Candidatus Methanomethylophilaceae archaeon]|nr:hypothetical protein [Candidatus Methanomethylophilaceae archaeon]
MRELTNTIAESGIKALDASHLASAIYAKCDYFITTDDRLLRYTTLIKQTQSNHYIVGGQ